MEGISLNPKVVNQLLDKAVATAARELLPCDGELDLDVAHVVVNQLEQLRARTASFHHPVIPVLYSTWFQLGHVNLGLVIAERMVRRWRVLCSGEDEMRVLDIGSGTLALPIAFDILRLTGKLDINVRILVIEPSREMEYCGRRVRHLLRNEVPWFRSLCDTTASFGTHINVRKNGPCFFASIHSMYPDIEKTFNAYFSQLQPVYGIATVNATERTALEKLENKSLPEYDSEAVNIERSTLGGRMPLTLRYRRDLWECVNSVNSALGGQVEGLMTNVNIPDWPDGTLVVKEYSLKPEKDGKDFPW